MVSDCITLVIDGNIMISLIKRNGLEGALNSIRSYREQLLSSDSQKMFLILTNMQGIIAEQRKKRRVFVSFIHHHKGIHRAFHAQSPHRTLHSTAFVSLSLFLSFPEIVTFPAFLAKAIIPSQNGFSKSFSAFETRPISPFPLPFTHLQIPIIRTRRNGARQRLGKLSTEGIGHAKRSDALSNASMHSRRVCSESSCDDRALSQRFGVS